MRSDSGDDPSLILSDVRTKSRILQALPPKCLELQTDNPLFPQILLEHGAGINTHSNEFKESALTLACYKGHLDMVRYLLEAGADQEHKTDEMHTALMEASMDGHVEVARLLLDSGAQVNMPTDSFESPLTLAACGGHVDLAMLLIERGANIEEVNDEGYTPLMEAAREGHEEMVALLLQQGEGLFGGLSKLIHSVIHLSKNKLQLRAKLTWGHRGEFRLSP